MVNDSGIDNDNDDGGDHDPSRERQPEQTTASRKLIESRGEFHAALRESFASAARTGCRELMLCDVNYADWPLGEIKVVDALTQWAYAHRKLTLYALDFDEFARRHPRWVEWRRKWTHVVECRSLNELEASQVPTVLLASGLATVRLFDPIHYRGTVSSLQVDLVAARESLDAAAQRSVEAFPATTLGL